MSSAALGISAFVAGWTVYRDVIQRPRFRVSVAVKSVYREGHEPIGPDFYVEALNIGPIPNRIGLVFAQPNWIDRKIFRKPSAMITHDHAHIANTANAQRVEVGDAATFVFPINGEFLAETFAKIGVTDGYGRTHWAKKKNVRVACDDARKAIDDQQ